MTGGRHPLSKGYACVLLTLSRPCEEGGHPLSKGYVCMYVWDAFTGRKHPLSKGYVCMYGLHSQGGHILSLKAMDVCMGCTHRDDILSLGHGMAWASSL